MLQVRQQRKEIYSKSEAWLAEIKSEAEASGLVAYIELYQLQLLKQQS